jgi:hypothetical protein
MKDYISCDDTESTERGQTGPEVNSQIMHVTTTRQALDRSRPDGKSLRCPLIIRNLSSVDSRWKAGLSTNYPRKKSRAKARWWRDDQKRFLRFKYALHHDNQYCSCLFSIQSWRKQRRTTSRSNATPSLHFIVVLALILSMTQVRHAI